MPPALPDNMGPQRLHPDAAFEGFYTKFALPSGANLIVIPCSVSGAPDPSHRHGLSIVYIPASTSQGPAQPWTHEVNPTRILTSITDKQTNAFTLVCLDSNGQDFASFTSTPTENTYQISLPSLPLAFRAKSSKRTSWSPKPVLGSPSSPEGLLSYLPLPLHWHVHSLSSQTRFELQLPPEAGQGDGDREGEATAHEEKNWANGFPSAHVWCQARSPPGASILSLGSEAASATAAKPGEADQDIKSESGICLAGGQTMGLLAFLVGYRHKSAALGELELDFRPPFAVGLPWNGGCLSPFLDFYVDWPSRRWRVDVVNWRWRIVVEASGPGVDLLQKERGKKEGWFQLSAPKPEGMVEKGTAQTTAGTVKIRLLRRRFGWLGWRTLWKWDQVCEEVFEQASVEFGGDYYHY